MTEQTTSPRIPRELRERIPGSNEPVSTAGSGPIGIEGLGPLPKFRGTAEILGVMAVFAVVFFGLQAALVSTHTPDYVFPRPFSVVVTLTTKFGVLYASYLWVTVQELLIGFAIGSTVGVVLAAVITQRPFLEKLIVPYILILITTPMIALVPFLMLKFGFGSTPKIIAVALASGPMVMINASTGFRRTDLAKIALARSYGASTWQIFYKIRLPFALPMILVGYMVGCIFGLLTAVGAEMVGGGGGLGQRLVYFSSLLQMPAFGGAVVLISALGIVIYVIFYFIAKRWTNWQT